MYVVELAFVKKPVLLRNLEPFFVYMSDRSHRPFNLHNLLSSLPLHTIPHPPQNRLSLLDIFVIIDPQAIRQQECREIGMTCIFSRSVRVLDLRWVGDGHGVEAGYV
jgi:hypothetical protein